MPVPEIDLTGFDRSIEILQEILSRRTSGSPILQGEELYYKLLIQLFHEIKRANDEGQPFFLYEVSVPNELFVAMGVPAAEYLMVCGLMSSVLRAHETIYGAAVKVGIREEICSAHRIPIGVLTKGWFPRPTGIVFSSLDQCDNCAQNGNLLGYLYNTPTHFMSRPNRWWDERGVRMITGELEDTVAFLEKQTGRKMDWDKLGEAISISVEQVRLIREIHKLAMAKPCPLKARAATFAHWVRWGFAGRPEGLTYFKAFRDEMKALVDQGKGIIPNERFRLMSLFTPPQNQMKMLDGLEREMGVVFVSEPYYMRYGDYDMDPSTPLESLSRQFYNESYYRFYGEMEEYLDMIVQDAKESGAEAAINWFNSKCRMGGAMTKIVKDTLADKVGIPVCTIDVDMLDPSPAAEKRTKERLEGFLEQLSMGKAPAALK